MNARRPHITTTIHTTRGAIEVSSVHGYMHGQTLNETCIFWLGSDSEVVGTYDDHQMAVERVLAYVDAGIFIPSMRMAQDHL